MALLEIKQRSIILCPGYQPSHTTIRLISWVAIHRTGPNTNQPGWPQQIYELISIPNLLRKHSPALPSRLIPIATTYDDWRGPRHGGIRRRWGRGPRLPADRRRRAWAEETGGCHRLPAAAGGNGSTTVVGDKTTTPRQVCLLQDVHPGTYGRSRSRSYLISTSTDLQFTFNYALGPAVKLAMVALHSPPVSLSLQGFLITLGFVLIIDIVLGGLILRRHPHPLLVLLCSPFYPLVCAGTILLIANCETSESDIQDG